MPEQTTVGEQGVRIRATVRAGHQADHTERAEAAEQVTGQVNANRFHRHLTALQSNQRHQQVAEMRDRRVTEQTFNIGLAQRHQVTEDDGSKGNHAQYDTYRFAIPYRCVQEQTHHHAEDSDFARRRQEGGNRSRSALVNVWRPQVERNQRKFKAEANNHQTEARQQQRFVQHAVAEALTERNKRQIARLRVHQRHTEQQEGRRCGRQNGVFDTGFQRTFLTERIANQTKQRQRDQLNTKEQRRQMVSVSQQNTAECGNQHQQVELFPVVVVAFQPRVSKGTGGKTGQQHQSGVEHGETVNPHQRGDVHGARLANKPERNQRGVKPNDR